MYNINSASIWGARSLDGTPCCHAALGGLSCHGNSIHPPVADMIPPTPAMLQNNGDFVYHHQYPSPSCVHSSNYGHNCCETSCGLSHYSKDLNTPCLSHHRMSAVRSHPYNDVNYSQHGCTQRKSISPFYGDHNNGQNHLCNQPSQFLHDQRSTLSFFDKESQQQQRGVSPYQYSGSESDEIEYIFNSKQQNIAVHSNNQSVVTTELLVDNLDQNIDPKKMKNILESKFMEYVRVLNTTIFVKSINNYTARITVPSLQDAQYAILKLHGYCIGNNRISVSYAHIVGPNHQELKSQIILLLQKVPGHALSLFKFLEMYATHYLTSVKISDLYKMQDVCTISEDSTGRTISLIPQNTCSQRDSLSLNHANNNNCHGSSCDQTSQFSHNQRATLPYFDTQIQQQQRGVSPYQPSKSGSDEREYIFNPIQHNKTTHIDESSDPVKLVIQNLDQSIDAKTMKHILETKFRKHVKILSISTFLQSNGDYAANITVPSLQDAQYAITQLHRRHIGNNKIVIGYANINGLNNQQIKSQIILLLQEVPDHKLPLFKFREIFKSRFLTSVSISDLCRMPDVCIISEDLTGRIISLNPDYRNTPSPYLDNNSENEQIEFPYCTVHSKKPWMDKDWSEQEITPLPNVTMSLQVLEILVHELLKSHNGCIPLPSITNCYEAEFQQPIYDDHAGVPLEHLISCLSSVELHQGVSSAKFIVWANNKMTNNEPVINSQLNTKLSFLSRELIILLETASHCQIPFDCLIPAYRKHFGRQCRIADYGFTKLIDLLDILKQTVQVMGNGNQRIITLTHHAQIKRFTFHLNRILKSQLNKQITLSEFPIAYEKIMGKPFNITDYGVCQITDILNEVPQSSVVVIDTNDNDKLMALPRQEQTPEQIEKTKEFSIQVVELLSLAPQCSMLFDNFIPSYHYHFGYQCRIADYGFSKLIELFEAIPDVVQIEDTNDGQRLICLVKKN